VTPKCNAAGKKLLKKMTPLVEKANEPLHVFSTKKKGRQGATVSGAVTTRNREGKTKKEGRKDWGKSLQALLRGYSLR